MTSRTDELHQPSPAVCRRSAAGSHRHRYTTARPAHHQSTPQNQTGRLSDVVFFHPSTQLRLLVENRLVERRLQCCNTLRRCDAGKTGKWLPILQSAVKRQHSINFVYRSYHLPMPDPSPSMLTV